MLCKRKKKKKLKQNSPAEAGVWHQEAEKPVDVAT